MAAELMSVGAFGRVSLDAIVVSADVATCVAFSAVIQRIKTSGTAEGLSLQTLVALVTVRFLHLGSHLLGLHYVPMAIPAMVFLILDIVSAIAGLASLGLLFQRFHTYESSKDNFGVQLYTNFNIPQIPNPFLSAASVLYATVFIAAIIWHQLRHFAVQEDRPAGFYMSFYECMSGLAYVPQLWMFHQDKRVPTLLARFVIAMAVHKMLVLSFWTIYPSIVGVDPPNRHIQIVFDSVCLCILGDFIYYWARSKWHGYPEVILDSEIPLADLAHISAQERSCYEDTQSVDNHYLITSGYRDAASVFG